MNLTSCEFVEYCIAGKFGGEKVWQIWQIILDSPNQTIQISTYNYNLLAESIHLPNTFLPNVQNE